VTQPLQLAAARLSCRAVLLLLIASAAPAPCHAAESKDWTVLRFLRCFVARTSLPAGSTRPDPFHCSTNGSLALLSARLDALRREPDISAKLPRSSRAFAVMPVP